MGNCKSSKSQAKTPTHRHSKPRGPYTQPRPSCPVCKSNSTPPQPSHSHLSTSKLPTSTKVSSGIHKKSINAAYKYLLEVHITEKTIYSETVIKTLSSELSTPILLQKEMFVSAQIAFMPIAIPSQNYEDSYFIQLYNQTEKRQELPDVVDDLRKVFPKIDAVLEA